MLSSAVSTALVLAIGWSGQQLDTSEVSAWRRIEPNVIRVLSGNKPVGSAVLVDQKGHFLAHRSSVSNGVMFGRMASGETLQLSLVSVDEITQLALIRAEGWHPATRTASTVQSYSDARVQKASVSNATKLVIVLPERAIKGELTTSTLVGVMAPSLRGLTLSEIRFEDPGIPVGGGLAFTLDGRLVGVLGATLTTPAQSSNRDSIPGAAARGGGGGFAAEISKRSNFSPATLIVGYSITPDILERVLEGFMSPSRQAAHPALGLFCRDAQAGGALIDSLVTGSPAQQAGLRPGDVLFEMAGLPINNQIDYTRVLVRQTVGSQIQLKVRRGVEILTLSVKVGK
jgi:S1-C subfamily serine protease